MIRVEITKRAGVPVRFLIRDHAEYDEYGRDIVCAAVSALVINSINTILTILDYPLDYEIDEKGTKIGIRNDGSDEKVNLILASLELGLQNTKDSYGEYIDIRYREV